MHQLEREVNELIVFFFSNLFCLQSVCDNALDEFCLGFECCDLYSFEQVTLDNWVEF